MDEQVGEQGADLAVGYPHGLIVGGPNGQGAKHIKTHDLDFRRLTADLKSF
ncbi:hypothetical protein GCM10010439_59600 [Actinocorallia aurantiaca]|uniref:Uncharacterized protein n=1 Tax=Actinocorallia aurantiaca TaxID=46204 RepID=A0ABN3UQL8_9ACTN